MKIITGKTKFRRPILYLGTGILKYKERTNITHEIRSAKNAGIYYIGSYTILQNENKCTLELNTTKNPCNAFRFLLNEKQLYNTKEYKIDTIQIRNPQDDNITIIQLSKSCRTQKQ